MISLQKLFAMTLVLVIASSLVIVANAEDRIRELQNQAIKDKKSKLGHWGDDPDNYTQWGTHSSRLIPVYTFGTKSAGEGIDLDSYTGEKSAYRTEKGIRRIWGRVPDRTVNPTAVYCDQTNLAELQKAALAAGKKHIFLVVFDGMDWQTTRNAAIAKRNRIEYTEGRGTGLHFQDYDAKGTSQFGFMVTSPLTSHAKENVNEQTIEIPADANPGGYCPELAGAFPWSTPRDLQYLIGKSKELRHAYPDSANTASSMTSGTKTYNGSINIDGQGQQTVTVAHLAQDKGYAVGAVSSVPISHATPAASYAHNVSRDDYQDLTRDLLGLPSISHPNSPLPGLDVLIAGGYGTEREKDSGQGKNHVSGNRYLTAADLKTIDVKNRGRYVVSLRTAGKDGGNELAVAAKQARENQQRLFGFYGVGKYDGHLPFQTADGDYKPALGRRNAAEEYTPADLLENPTLAEMTAAAIDVLSADEQGFWLMVEAGDVDWANHDNNLDNSIGAVFSGDDAVKIITDWVETNSNWDESVMIVTADHGHYFHLDRPEMLVAEAPTTAGTPTLMAHRGLLRLAPENTLSAFSAALERGYDIELDVYLTKDGEAVVIHDETLDRTTNGTGKVTEKTWDEIKDLDAGSWFDPAFSSERIPTLREVLLLVLDQQVRPTTIAINMKTISPGIEQKIVKDVNICELRSQVFCFGMNAESNARFKAIDPTMPTAATTTGFNGWDLKRAEDFSRAVADDSIDVLWVNFVPTREQLAEAHAQGKKIWMYVAKDFQQLEVASKAPLDGLCSDMILDLAGK